MTWYVYMNDQLMGTVVAATGAEALIRAKAKFRGNTCDWPDFKVVARVPRVKWSTTDESGGHANPATCAFRAAMHGMKL